MIELGSMAVRDQDSISEVRGKVLGLARALGCGEVAATRAATGVSEAARRCVAALGGAVVRAEVTGHDSQTWLRLVFETESSVAVAEPLGLFFDRVVALGPDAGRTTAADLRLPAGLPVLDEHWISRERARIARRSRQELMEELRGKNRQLEEYSEGLEATVAQRTAELRLVNHKLQSDLDAGAAYVMGLIPPPMTGPVSIGWRYVPSSTLGGDTIGYHWLDADHLAMYLVDVTGHGLDSALLAVTVTNVIRSASLPGADMRRPGEVLLALNNAFQAVDHGAKYFTIWYGVYRPSLRRLSWSGGGHHPSVLLPGATKQAVALPASGPIMGAVPDMDFPAEECDIPAGARLMIFSDGVFEILRGGRLVWTLGGVNDYLAERAAETGSLMEGLLCHVRELRGSDHLDDDFSILEVRFA